jgi:quinol monooxygenase YgiN
MKNTVVCTYRVKKGKEAAFRRLLKRHWPTLRRRGLVEDERPRHYRGSDGPGRTFFVEIFTWKGEEAVKAAHESPEVASIWEPMGALVENRNGRPGMEFPHVEPLRA